MSIAAHRHLWLCSQPLKNKGPGSGQNLGGEIIWLLKWLCTFGRYTLYFYVKGLFYAECASKVNKRDFSFTPPQCV